MFDPQGRNILPAAILYKKEYSCSKRQFSSGYQSKHGYVSLKMFLDENKVEKENTLVVLKLPIKLTLRW
jgi:hypothetical protein